MNLPSPSPFLLNYNSIRLRLRLFNSPFGRATPVSWPRCAGQGALAKVRWTRSRRRDCKHASMCSVLSEHQQSTACTASSSQSSKQITAESVSASVTEHDCNASPSTAAIAIAAADAERAIRRALLAAAFVGLHITPNIRMRGTKKADKAQPCWRGPRESVLSMQRCGEPVATAKF